MKNGYVLIAVYFTEFGRKIMLIAEEFGRLDNVFKEILSPKIWDEALATLVDHTINELCSKVIALDDISVDTANELALLFNQFALCILKLFHDDSLSERELEGLTGQKVQKWRRFRLLVFILTASMKEIGDKYVKCGVLPSIRWTLYFMKRLFTDGWTAAVHWLWSLMLKKFEDLCAPYFKTQIEGLPSLLLLSSANSSLRF